MALKPPGQATVLRMNTNTAPSQVKPGKGKIQSYAQILGMSLGRVQGLGARARLKNLSRHQN